MSGCGIESKEDNESREIAIQCVEQDKSLIIQMYDICKRNQIDWIITADNNSSLDWAVNVAYDDKNYLISTPAGKDADPKNEDFLDAGQIFGRLNSDYNINHILYSKGFLEIRFSNNLRALMYSPESEPSKDFNAERIEDGFYTYMLKSMF